MPTRAEDPTVKLVKAIIQAGPRNFSQLARLTGIPAETVRYKIKSQLVAKGIYIHAIPDTSKLGLQRFMAHLTFTDNYRSVAKALLQSLHELSYLTYYSAELMTKRHYCLFQVPIEFKNEFTEFLDAMIDYKILESYSLWPIAWINYISLKPEYFDFQREIWDIDWQHLSPPADIPQITPEEIKDVEFDKSDLLLIKELTVNSMSTIADISKKIGSNVKTLQYHYLSHVLGRNMIKNYTVRWMGDIESTRMHRIVFMRLYMERLTRSEMDLMRRVIYGLPFTWSEIISDNRQLFVSGVCIPVDQIMDYKYYMHKNLGDLGSKLEERVLDVFESGAFTLPYNLYDPTFRKWTFDIKKNVSGLQNFQMAYKQ
ncbi:MAG: hypothetical protein QXQ39_07675 [Conexivisphaerales archaeon]